MVRWWILTLKIALGLRRGKVRLWLLFFLIPFPMLNSACTDLSRPKKAAASSVLSGTVGPIASLSSQGVGGLSCNNPMANLYGLNGVGGLILPAIASTPVSSNGAYTFNGLSALGVSISNGTISGNFIVEISGCSSSLTRVVTGVNSQDISYGSSLIDYIVGTSYAASLPTADKSQLSGLISQLSNYNDYNSAYSGLTANSTLTNTFQGLLGIPPTNLSNTPPQLLSSNIPSLFHEGQVNNFSLTVAQWSSSYQPAFLWELDGYVIGTGTLPAASFTPGANAQGNHILSAFFGATSGGTIDQTQPMGAQSFNISIANDLPAVAPALSVSSGTTNVPAISLQIATGLALANCSSFSYLAITEDTAVKPSPNAFTISCALSPTQIVNYNLQHGEGTRILRLWAMDSAGNISATASSTSIVYSIPFSGLTVSPGTASFFQTPTLSGTTAPATIVALYSLPGCMGSVLTNGTSNASGSFSLTAPSSLGAAGTYNLSILATDTNNNTLCSANVPYVVNPLSFSSIGVQNQQTNTNSVTFTGVCTNGLPLVVSGSDSGSAACASGTFAYTTANQVTDGTRTYNIKQTDPYSYSSTIVGTWQRSTVLPIVGITSPIANFAAQNGVSMAGSCQNGLGVLFSGSGALGNVNGICSSGTFGQFIYFSAGDGAKAITVSQTDAFGNIGSANGSYIRDTTPPALTQTLNPSPYYTNTNSPTFGGACETGLTIYITGTDTASTTCSSGSWSYTAAIQTVDASYVYIFTQTDAAGNVGNTSNTWIRKTIPPVLTFTSSSAFVTSGSIVSFAGTCSSGLLISVSGSGTANINCSGGLWSYSPSNTVDGNYTYTFTETDQAGNISTLNGTWLRSTAGPTLTITQASPQITTTNNLTISGNCNGGTAGSNGVISITGSFTGTTTCSSNNATMGTWSYSPTQTVDGVYNYTFSTTDNFSTPRTTSASLVWERDTTPPAISASSFIISGGTTTTTATSYTPISFNATDNVSFVTSFCLKTTSATPLASDPCWYAVNGSATNVVPSNSISISNYSFNLGIVPQSYSVFLWVMDGAGNISINTNTAGTDVVTITLAPVSPPSVSTVLASNSNTMNGLASERIIPGGSDVYIRWTATGSSLGATPVTVYFTTDDANWTSIAANLANGLNNCTSITGPGSASATATGCYKWGSGSPTGSYYRIRVSVANTVNGTTFANSQPINAAPMQILAGNTETGLNGTASSAIFQANYSVTNWVDGQNIVVNSTGTIYFRDITNGIVSINPVDGKVKQLIPMGATTSGYGDGGSISSAKLRLASAIAIDGQDRLIIWDYDRIRRVDFSVTPAVINTIIGGGANTADTISNGTSMSLSSVGSTVANTAKSMMYALPNGNIYFVSETYGIGAYKRMRIYNASTNAISSIYVSGSSATISNSTYSIADYTKCGFESPVLNFDPSTSNIINFYAMIAATGTGDPGCTTVSSGVNWIAPLVKFDPSTGVVDNTQIPASYTGSTSDYLLYATPVTAMDGKIYIINQVTANIRKFDPTSNTWTTIVGTGLRSSCVDGTLASSCAFDPGGAFVDAHGQLYFVDRGRIRTIVSGNIVTIYGQNFSFGDGGLATNARFGLVTAVQERSDSQFILNDRASARFRLFSRGGAISTIAGNDTLSSSGSTTVAATALPLNSTNQFPAFFLDASDGLYFPEYGINNGGHYLPSTYATSPSTTDWVVPTDSSHTAWFTGANAFYNSSANGTLAGTVGSIGGNFRFIGFNGTSLLMYFDQGATPYSNQTIVEVNVSNGMYNIDMGPGAGNTGYCADGTALNTCASSAVPVGIAAGYDSNTNLWQILSPDSRTVRTFGTGETGTIQTATVFAAAASSFVFKRFSSYNNHAYYYYCNSSNGKIYVRDATTSTEAALNWPIASAKCSGVQMVYDSNTDSIITPFTQNGLFGVVEILNAAPSANGL